MTNLFKQLRPASFRGVSFYVPDDDLQFGRRVITDEYPGRDVAGHDDLGAAVESYSVTAIILGTNFISLADSLQAALQKKGPGLLIHPHFGEINGIVKSVRRAHSSSSTGEVQFSITFEKYGEPAFPASLTDTASALGLAADSLVSALRGDFQSALKVTGIADFVSADGIARANSFISNLNSALSQGGLLKVIGFALPSFDALGLGIIDDVMNLFDNISSLAQPKRKAIIGPSSTNALNATDTVKMMKALTVTASTSVLDSVPATTINQSTRQKNAAAIDNAFRGAAVAAIANVARYATYESKEQALSIRANVAAVLSNHRDQMGLYGWDDSWKASGQTLAALSRDVNDRIGRLPRTVTIRPKGQNSSLQLANRLYGDDPTKLFDKAADLVARNSIRHPGFVPVKEMEALIATA